MCLFRGLSKGSLRLIAVGFFFFLAGIAQAVPASAEEIVRFSSDIVAKNDASMMVTETIEYNFGDASRHGIYRDIPTEYVTKLGAKQSINIKVESVTDESEKGYASDTPYEESSSGGVLDIKIGDPNTLVSGQHTYVIRYRVLYAFGYFDSYDELYWNATGNGWQVPIGRAEAKLTLPENVPKDKAETSCYLGAYGSSESCDASAAFDGHSYIASAPRGLEPGEGLTIAVGFPKGIIREIGATERVWNFIKDNPAVILPFFVFGFMFRRWYRYGRDPEGRGTIIPEYDMPKGLSLLETAGLMKSSISAEHISAGIVDLAVRGYLKIRKTEKKILIFSSDDYAFTRTDKGVEDAIDRQLLEALFGGADSFGKEVELSSLKQKFYKSIPEIDTLVIGRLVEKKYFEKNPKSIIGWYILYGVIGGGVAFFLFSQSAVSVIAIIVSLVIYFIFAVLMPRVTKEGAIMKEYIAGLKEYLSIAEKNRIEFHNAPEKRPEIFEKLLPIAMVLGVEKLWAKEFEDMYTTEPSWYSDAHGVAFSASAFTSDLGSFQTAASQTLGSAPGGSSGSGGGGFSGGGGGGGGGGSW
jgi:hypothetical protein